MIGLEKYLKESLLDDFDTLNNGVRDAQAEDLIRQADIIAGTKDPWRSNNGGHMIPTRKEDIPDHFASTLENGVLKLAKINVYTYDRQVHDILKKVRTLTHYDTIQAYNDFNLYVREADDSIAKEIIILNGGLILGPELQKIENIKFKIGVDSDTTFGPAVLSKGFDVVFNNCSFYNPGRKALNARMRFGGMPVFKNCKIEGIKWLSIYSPSVLKDRNLKTFENLIDPSHQAMYKGIGVKKGNFKQVYACLNNPRKYQFVPSEYGDTVFKINPKFKLEDLFDIKCFDDNLEKIQISDNNIGIAFYKNSIDRGYLFTGFDGRIGEENIQTLPNNKDWNVVICKKKK